MRNNSVTKSSPTDVLGQVPLFRGCSKDELKQLDRATTRTEFPAGHVLCREGAVGRELVILLDGKAAVERGGVEITVLGPGDFIGEMSLLDGGPRSATVTTLTDVSALVLMPHEFWHVIDEVPSLSHKLLSALASRLRAADAAAYHH
jgi:CRP/FNR family cyclic AMP-dependent transcriptional regulator